MTAVVSGVAIAAGRCVLARHASVFSITPASKTEELARQKGERLRMTIRTSWETGKEILPVGHE